MEKTTFRARIRPWMSLIAAFLILASSIGLGTNGLSLFYVPVTESLGFTQTAFSVYYAITMYVTALLCPVVGKIFTKRENLMKPMMAGAAALTALCFFLYSRCSSLPAFYAVSTVRGVCNAVLSNVAATMVVNHWFFETRGLAVSICLMGTSAGGLLFTQLSRLFLEHFTWRQSYWMLGLVGLALNVIMLLLIEPSPERIGLHPYGFKPESKEDTLEREGVTFAEAVKTPSFWMILVSIFIASITVQGTQQAVTTALQYDHSHSQAIVTTVVSIFMILLCVGKIIIGSIYDKKGLRSGIIYSCTLLVLSYACLLLAKDVMFAYIFAVIFGLGNMMSSVTATTATTATFGLKEYGVIFGFVSMCSSFGNATGPMISSKIYDITGQFTLVWVVYAGFNIIATTLIILANYLMMKKEKKILFCRKEMVKAE